MRKSRADTGDWRANITRSSVMEELDKVPKDTITPSEGSMREMRVFNLTNNTLQCQVIHGDGTTAAKMQLPPYDDLDMVPHAVLRAPILLSLLPTVADDSLLT